MASQRLAGTVNYNDGNLAEVQTYGTERDGKDLILDAIQLHRGDTDDTSEEFKARFPVGMQLRILRSIQVVPPVDSEDGAPYRSSDMNGANECV